MFPDMVKHTLALTPEECEAIVAESTSGVLLLSGINGYPYPVPMSYAYQEGKLWFHSAKVGYKAECMKAENKAAFSIISQDTIVPEALDTWFESVNLFGKIHIHQSAEEKRKALSYLVQRYSPGFEQKGEETTERLWNATMTFELQIEHMTGKASKEVLEQKRKQQG